MSENPYIQVLEDRNRDLRAQTVELLAALKRLCEAPCPNKYDERWTKASAAIAKAEGKL